MRKQFFCILWSVSAAFGSAFATGFENITSSCKKNFVNIGNYCYQYTGIPQLPYTSARAFCEENGNRLAEVNVDDNEDNVVQLIRSHGFREMNYWINVSANTFGTGLQNNGETSVLASSCVVISSSPSYSIRTVMCNSNNLFVCQHDVIRDDSLERGIGQGDFCRGKLGYFSHPRDCKQYILCFNERRRTFRCSPGQTFSRESRRCLASANCTESESPSEISGNNRNSGNNSRRNGDEIRKQTNIRLKCDSDFAKHRSKCYKVFERRLAWNDARSQCITETGELVTIKDRRLMSFLRKIIERENISGDFWIGLNDRNRENVFKWKDGSVLTSNDYQFWSRNSRRRMAPEKDCIKLDSMARLRWIDASCNERNYFICEKDAVRAWQKPDEDCGLYRKKGQPILSAVIGGTHALGQDHPWQASLRFEGDHKCGGSLIDSCWILTAAHCLSPPLVEEHERPTEVVLGDYNLVSKETFEERLSIEEFFVHPQFSTKPTPSNDIAIIKLANCSQFHNPICLPKSRRFNFPPGTACNIAGYGTVNPRRVVYPNKLMEAIVPLIDKETCRSLYKLPSDRKQSAINDGMFCAGYLAGGIDACQGDSGGPLTCKNNDTNRETQWGIVSWGNGCAKAKKPGVYTLITHYLNWIRNVTMIKF